MWILLPVVMVDLLIPMQIRTPILRTYVRACS